MLRQISRADLQALRDEYSATVAAARRWDPVRHTLSEAETLIRQLIRDTPESDELRAIERNVGRARKRFEAFASTYDTRWEIVREAFRREHPGVPHYPPRPTSVVIEDEWSGPWRGFLDKWEAENGPL